MKNLFLGLFLLSISLTVQADFNQAIKNYEEGNYQEALTEFQSLSEIGNKSAQYNLGFMYLDGLGTKQDLVKAYAWIKLSDEEGEHSETQDVLNQIAKHLNEAKLQKVEDFYSQIFSSFGKAAIVSDLEPIFDVHANGDDKFKAKPIKTTPAKYPNFASRKGLEGYVKLEFSLNNDGSPKNIRILNSYPKGVFERATLAAIRHWKFEKGSDNERIKYTMSYQFEGTDKGYVKPRYKQEILDLIDDIEKKAKAGDAVSEYYFAVYGPNFKPEEKINSTEWFYKAAQKGIADAQYQLGLNLLNGQGCKSDKIKGVKWLVKAASGDLGRSQFELARLYRQKTDNYDIEKSDFWLNKAIEAKDKDVAFELALYLLENTNFPVEKIEEVLSLVKKEEVADVVSYYEVYALFYAKKGDYSEAASRQNRANIMVNKLTGKTPQAMKDKKAYYKSMRNT